MLEWAVLARAVLVWWAVSSAVCVWACWWRGRCCGAVLRAASGRAAAFGRAAGRLVAGWPGSGVGPGGCRTGSVLSRARGIIVAARGCLSRGGRTSRSTAIDGRLSVSRGPRIVQSLGSQAPSGNRQSKNRQARCPRRYRFHHLIFVFHNCLLNLNGDPGRAEISTAGIILSKRIPPPHTSHPNLTRLRMAGETACPTTAD